MDRPRARFHQRSGDVRAFVSRVGDERGWRILARVGRRRARGATRIRPDWGFVATAPAVATSRARRARSTRRVAGWWPTRRARFDLMTASNTAVTTRSREIAGAPRDAPHAVRRDSTRNRPPIGTRATRDASSRPPPAPLGVAETDARGASQAQRNWQCVLVEAEPAAGKN